MPFIPITIPPGVVKTNSDFAATGRWIDMDKVRFTSGFPEKIGGIRKFFAGQFTGKARGARAWSASDGVQHLMWGTQNDLYVLRQGTKTRITPYRKNATNIALTDPFSTTNGSPIVTVTDTLHGISNVGVTVTFSGASAVGGITINGDYLVTEIVDPDNFKITHTSNATSTATGGGSVTASYEINFGLESPSYALGWGVGGWGEGYWGMEASIAESTLSDMRWWSIDGYGEDVMVCPLMETVYHYDTSAGPARPAKLTNAPAQIRYVFVTPERYIFALGCTNLAGDFDAMTVRWPDVDDFTVWTPTSTNTANERKLQLGSRLMAGVGLTSGVSLVWSDYAVFAFQFTGSRFIYDDHPVGTECGLIGPHAFCKTDQMAFWMSAYGFHVYSSYVQSIPNQDDIRDWVAAMINIQHLQKTFAFYNKNFNEVWFVFPTTTSEPDTYVAVNLDAYYWMNGTYDRTCHAKYTSGEIRPILFGTNGYIYLHETTDNHDNDGAAMRAFLDMGLFALNDGNDSVDIFGFAPDTQRQSGDLQVTMYAKDWPKDEVMDTDAITVGETDRLVDCRVSGRHVGLTIVSDTIAGDFRLGKFGVEITGAGKKR
jgi:hypothetical protein